ncbi:MAG: hypothetical protein M0040_03135 [Actinomycetota bacterium]|jgi:hypothetical protein|nr:hypothetical protein [Actinomycetota bacterium]
MTDVLVRVVLPDRPGALGAVASRIGSVGGDVVFIDILERSNGVVVDEIGVVLADAALVELMVGEVHEVDGAAVEAVRPVTSAAVDPRTELLAAATGLVRQQRAEDVLAFLVDAARAGFGAEHVAVAPSPEHHNAPDVAVAKLDAVGADLVVVRRHPVLRQRERTRLAELAELADHRWRELAARPAAS